MQLEFKQIIVPPGQQLLLKNISWQQFKSILEELGERRAARISYSQGMLEIMSPLPEYEDDKIILTNLVEILLEEFEREFRNLGSTTFKNESMNQAVEPDSCFYIQNEKLIRGKKKRIDLEVDPPPDLAIEIDITSRTRFNNYQELSIPELWRYTGYRLEIYSLQNQKYVASYQSLIFPNLPIIEVLPAYLEQSKVKGRNVTLKAFRNWLKEQLKISNFDA